DQRAPAFAKRGRDRFAPVGHKALDGVFEAFGQRKLFGLERSVTRVLGRVARVVGGEPRRRDIITAPPDVGLFHSVLGRSLGFVESLKRAVMALVQSPRLGNRNPEQVHPLERQVESFNRAFENRSVSYVEGVTGLFHLVSG